MGIAVSGAPRLPQTSGTATPSGVFFLAVPFLFIRLLDWLEQQREPPREVLAGTVGRGTTAILPRGGGTGGLDGGRIPATSSSNPTPPGLCGESLSSGILSVIAGDNDSRVTYERLHSAYYCEDTGHQHHADRPGRVAVHIAAIVEEDSVDILSLKWRHDGLAKRQLGESLANRADTAVPRHTWFVLPYTWPSCR